MEKEIKKLQKELSKLREDFGEVKIELARGKKIRNENNTFLHETLEKHSKILKFLLKPDSEDYETDSDSLRHSVEINEMKEKVNEIGGRERKRIEKEEKEKKEYDKKHCRKCGAELSQGLFTYGECKECRRKSTLRIGKI